MACDETPQDPADREGQAPDPERRRLLSKVTIGFGTLAALLAVTPSVGVLLWPIRRRDEEVWRTVAWVDDLPVGQTRKVTFIDPSPVPWAGFAATSAAWLRRDGETEFVAFSIYCTHTACPVRWDPRSELYLCPCHGGAFYADGSVAAGPPRFPLARHPVRIRNGRVELRTIGVPTFAS